jgi:hypothetical protein
MGDIGKVSKPERTLIPAEEPGRKVETAPAAPAQPAQVPEQVPA